MSKCKDCIHNKICEDWKNIIKQQGLNLDYRNIVCEDFKDKSKIMELPVEIGKKVYIAVFCRNVKTKQLEFSHFMVETVVGAHICDDRQRDCCSSKVKYQLRDYIITKTTATGALNRIPITKFGKTVFTSKEEAEKALGINYGLL